MTTVMRECLTLEDGDLPLSIACGRGGGAAVVIVPSAFGVAPDVEAQMAELASDACVVVSFDPFFRQDAGVLAYDDLPGVMRRLGQLERERCAQDVHAVLRWTRAQPDVRAVVALGVCFGGPFVLHAAADGLLDGVVTWHGSRLERYLARTEQVSCPLRFHFGSVDPITPPQAIEAVRAAFAQHADAQVFVHEGATHGFSHRAAPAYQPAAEQAGMQSVRELVLKV